MAMIYDTFLFHGELDILELRLNILGDVVDKFVMCEAKQSFNGEPYESLYLKNKDRFKKWEDKIIHYQFDLLADEALVEQAKQSKNTDYGNPYWMKVYYGMETLRKPLEGCKDDDIILISDVDEIPSPMISRLVIDDKIYGLEQLVYYYYLNNRCNEPWTGTIMLNYKRLKGEVINNIKQKGEVKLSNGGWHFTYQGGEEQMRFKIESSREKQDGFYNDSYYGVSTDSILQRAKEGKDIFPDNFRPEYKFWVDESEWPEYLKQNRHKYLNMLK